MMRKMKDGLPVLVCRCAWYLSLVIGGAVFGTFLTMLTPVLPVQGALLTRAGAIAFTIIAVLSTEHVVSQLLNQRRHAQEWSNQRIIHFHRQEIMTRIGSEGWLPVASQLIADALAEPVSISLSTPLLDVSSSPAPRFVIPGTDARRYYFTIHPKLLKRHGLVTCRARLIVLRDIGPEASIEAQAIWDELIHSASPAGQMFIPRGSEWFMLVEEPRVASKSVWASLIRAVSLPGSHIWRWSR
ncbi:MAG: hypothetical protein M1546_21830 [Chloroflexi bacterium]|nr:hypothetical protein [Chloroflexota bacterium]